MELRHLRYFIAVAEQLSFSRAAQQLGLAQPPLTQQIQALEAELAVQLFDRKTRPIRLTPAGQTFLQSAQAILTQVDQAVLTARQVHQGHLGKLTLGIHNSVANTILPSLLTAFHQRFPDVRLELREVTVPQELALLQNQQLDLVFHRSAAPYTNDSDLGFRALMQEAFLLVLPERHPLAELAAVPLTALKGESLILPNLDVLPFYRQVIDACRRAGFEAEVDLSIRSGGIITLLSLVAAGVGLSVLPSHVQVLRREGIVYRPIQGLDLHRHITVVWRQDDTSPVLRNFLDMMQTSTDLQRS
jgi:DNA-binding transcriptional LysR family regulator